MKKNWPNIVVFAVIIGAIWLLWQGWKADVDTYDDKAWRHAYVCNDDAKKPIEQRLMSCKNWKVTK